MKVSVVSYSLSQQPKTLSEWEDKLTNEILNQIQDGARIIVYPELFLMGLSDYFSGDLKTHFFIISEYLETKFLPALASVLRGKKVCLCLGTGPRVISGKIFNASPIWVNDAWIFQNKIHLTPWETHFTAGSDLQFFEFEGFTGACVICFDIEQPGLALKLKRTGVDFVLVPTATVNKNGNQRINRCASGRSIELGAAIFTAPLVGVSKCDLIDHNEGRQGFFLPAQEVVISEQESFSPYSTETHMIHSYELNTIMLREIKLKDEETKPYFKEDLILP